MQRTLKTTIGLGLLLLVTACGGSVDINAMKAERKEFMMELVTTLESIQDEDTAETASPKLKELGAQMLKYKAQRKDLSDAELESFENADAEMLELGSRMLEEMKRILSDDQIEPFLSDALASFR